MPTKIRLQRKGKKKEPTYNIVVADNAAPRDGRSIEQLGHFDPNYEPPIIHLDREKAFKWVEDGALPTETARSILSREGVMYRKHLARGVRKGILDQKEADKKYEEFLERKRSELEKRKDAVRKQEEKAEEERIAAEKKVSEERAAAIAKKQEEAATAEASQNEKAAEASQEAESSAEAEGGEASAPAEAEGQEKEEAQAEAQKAESGEKAEGDSSEEKSESGEEESGESKKE